MDGTEAIGPARQRSEGLVRLRAGPAAGAEQGDGHGSGHGAGDGGGHGPTGIRDLAESGPTRLRFPRRHAGDARAGEMEAVLVNTAGGIACGDRVRVDLDLDPGARLVLTTTAAEKLYRSDGPVSLIDNRVRLAGDARLAWLPQETILFDRARVRRRFEADLAAQAGLLVFEAVAFGRAARGERLTRALFVDAWRIRREGRLAYADTLRLDGPVSDLLARPAIGGGAGACATLLDLTPGAEARIEEARALLDGAGRDGVAAAASAWNGHLAVRLLAREIGALRGHAARFIAAWRGAPMPRVWQG